MTAPKSLAERERRLAEGRMIRERRLAKRLRHQDVANAIGQSRSYVCDLEKGRRGGRSQPAHITALLSAYLDIPLDDFFKARTGTLTVSPELSKRYRQLLELTKDPCAAVIAYDALQELDTVCTLASSYEHTDATVRELRELLTRVRVAFKALTKVMDDGNKRA